MSLMTQYKFLYKSKPSLSAGFTFIELILLTLVLGILSSVALNRASQDTSKIASSIAVQQIGSDIDYCRSLSFAKNDTITLLFDLTDNTYRVYSGRNNARSLITNFPNLINGKITFPKFGVSTIDLKNTTFYSQKAAAELQFLPGGIPYIGGAISVNNKTITIANETGRWIVN
jgi:Tfp pilus assembly protein FimT